MQKIIGLVGQAGSGKDTIGEAIINRLRSNNILSRRFAFGDNLKSVASILTGVNINSFHDQYKKENFTVNVNGRFINLRTLMQELGTDILRNYFGPNIWVNSLSRSFLFDSCRFPVITDVRFKNEAEFVKNNGGVLIKIDNPYLSKKSTHISETELNTIVPDYVIFNNYKEDPKGVDSEVTNILNEILNGQ